MMVEPLHKPPSKHDRSGIIIYCNRCDKTVTDICKESGKLLKKCLYGEFHRFKATFYGKDGKRQNRILESRDYHEAVLEKRRIESYFTIHSFSISQPANNFIAVAFTKIVSGCLFKK